MKRWEGLEWQIERNENVNLKANDDRKLDRQENKWTDFNRDKWKDDSDEEHRKKDGQVDGTCVQTLQLSDSRKENQSKT